MNNRSRAFSNEGDVLCNKDNKYDIVIGPVADNNMALLFRQYENEIIDFNTLLKVQIAAYYGRFCGAKRPQCEAERPGFLLI